MDTSSDLIRLIDQRIALAQVGNAVGVSRGTVAGVNEAKGTASVYLDGKDAPTEGVLLPTTFVPGTGDEVLVGTRRDKLRYIIAPTTDAPDAVRIGAGRLVATEADDFGDTQYAIGAQWEQDPFASHRVDLAYSNGRTGINIYSGGNAGVIHFFPETDTDGSESAEPNVALRSYLNSTRLHIEGTGIDFGDVSASTDAETLDDYEEGTWTPTGYGVTFASASGSYVKVGRMVMAAFDVQWPSTSDGSDARIQSLPFTNGSYSGGVALGIITGFATGAPFPHLLASQSFIIMRDYIGNSKTNLQMSTLWVQGTAVYLTSS